MISPTARKEKKRQQLPIKPPKPSMDNKEDDKEDDSIGQLLYSIITSDFVKGLSQDMIKFVAMFLLTSYLKGDIATFQGLGRLVNREVRDASTAANMATQTDDEDDEPEYKLPLILSALSAYQSGKDQESKDQDLIDRVSSDMNAELANYMAGLEELTKSTGELTKSTGDGLNIMTIGGGNGTRDRAYRINNGTRDRAYRFNNGVHTVEFHSNTISGIIIEAISFANRNNIPNRVLNTVLKVLARASVFLLICGVMHTSVKGLQYLINNYMDYKSMFAYYMEEYKNKRTPKTAKDIAEDVEHYKNWARENNGGKLPTKANTEDLEHVDQQIKEIEESSWFKKFYKNNIKPTTDKIYNIVTSDEAVTAAKITAQILILSLLMYAANEAKGAMYNYVVSPAYNRTMQAYYGMQNPLRNLNEIEGLISLDPKHPNYRNYEEMFRASEPRLREMGYENRELFFKKNPKSSMRKHFPVEVKFKDADSDDEGSNMYIDALLAPRSSHDIRMDAENAEKKAQKKVSTGKGLSEHKNKFYTFIASDEVKDMAKKTVVGLITTVLTILAAQSMRPKDKSVISPNISVDPPTRRNVINKSNDDLSYYGIPTN